MNQSMEMSERIVSRVADCKGVSEDALPQLYHSIEPDALEELVKHVERKLDASVKVQFDYADQVIVVQGPEDIAIEG